VCGLIALVLGIGFAMAPPAYGVLNVNVLQVNGSGAYVQAADADNLTDFAGGAFTIQAWIYGNNFNLSRPIASKYADTGNQRSWVLLITTTGQLRAYVSGDGTAGTTYMWQTTGTVVTSDIWYHVAFVCDPAGADKIKFYVDNVEKPHTSEAQDPPASVFNSTAPMYVGRFLTQYFNGYIDEFRLTEGVLTSFPSNVFDLPLTANASTEVLYHFNESSGDALDASAVPNNPGTMMGSASRTAWNALGEGADLPLPVTLIALAANSGDRAVTVMWTTESEIDNLGFHVYRSTNQNNGFARVTSQIIPSQGFSTTTHDYQFQDSRELLNGVTYFYKLSDVDVNGRERQHEALAQATPSSSALVPGEVESLAPYQLSQNYPNPFNAITTIRYYVRNAGYVRLSVYDLTGKEVALLVNSRQTSGEHQYQFDASAYPAGLYFIRLTGENGYDNMKKMLFLK
jgi:hypothetical protein